MADDVERAAQQGSEAVEESAPALVGVSEDYEEIAPPTSELVWRGDVAGGGFFGGGFRGGEHVEGPYVAVGGGRVFVSSYEQNRVFMYGSRVPASESLGSFSASGPTGIAYYRGEVYVAEKSAKRVSVFDLDGNVRRRIATQVCATAADVCADTPSALIAPHGLDVVWGQVHVLDTELVRVYDARSGVFLGAFPHVDATSRASSDKGGPDVSAAPDKSEVLVGREAYLKPAGAAALGALTVERDPLRPLDWVGGPTPTTWCWCTSQRGSDSVWGMKWHLSVDWNGEYIMEYSDIGWAKRWWQPQSYDASDVVYNKRELRLDWGGPLTERDRGHLRGSHYLDYIVSDADVFVVGRNGEHWLEPARAGVRRVRLTTSTGQVLAESTSAYGRLWVNTSTLANGTHTLILTAELDGEDPKQEENPNLRIDNSPPGGDIEGLSGWQRGEVAITGSMSEPGVEAGPRDWQVEVQQRVGGVPIGGWQAPCGRQPSQANGQRCDWDTGGYTDGIYAVRADKRDRVQGLAGEKQNGGPNAAYTGEVEVRVDNSPPAIPEPQGSLWDHRDRTPIYSDERPTVTAQAHDTASGMAWLALAIDGVERHRQSCSSGVCSLTYTLDPSSVPEGTRTIQLTARDHAGHAAAPREWMVEVRSSPPDAPDQSAADPLDQPDSSEAAETDDEAPDTAADNTPFGSHPSHEPRQAATGLECPAGNPYVISDRLDYLAEHLGSPTPLAALSEFFSSSALLPPLPLSLFDEVYNTPDHATLPGHLESELVAMAYAIRPPERGWQVVGLIACSAVINEYAGKTLPRAAATP